MFKFQIEFLWNVFLDSIDIGIQHIKDKDFLHDYPQCSWFSKSVILWKNLLKLLGAGGSVRFLELDTSGSHVIAAYGFGSLFGFS